MKRKLLLKFATYLERRRNSSFNAYDSTACIASHARRFADPSLKGGTVSSTPGSLKNIFDMPEDMAHDIFFVRSPENRPVTKEAAVRLLRYLAHTGRLDWRSAFKA